MNRSRRAFLEVALTAALAAAWSGRAGRAVAQQRLRQEDLLGFEPLGQVSILHVADLHAQLEPIYLREPAVNLGVGGARGLPPHITGEELLRTFAIPPRSHLAYALASSDFAELALAYGRVGGADRLATVIKAIRDERGAGRTLLLDGGDALQGSYTALASKGADMVEVMGALGIEATTGHWEFTLGTERVAEIYGTRQRPGASKVAFLAGNVVERDFEEPVFHAVRRFEKGGIPIAVIGQAFPYTPIANPAWMIPEWSFGIREEALRREVNALRQAGAELVILLSHNGFDVDRKLASRVDGIDVILTAHTHDALPRPVTVGRTLLIASGSHGKFVSRLDLEVRNGRVSDYRYSLIPVLADVIAPDRELSAIVRRIRAPHASMLATELGRTRSLLYRRDTFRGTLDDVICAAMLEERDAELCFSPGFRWGASLLAGAPITWEDIYNATAITYPACYRRTMSGATIKAVLEDVADNLLYPDPYYQQGGDMVRTGGLAFTIDVDAPSGRRISELVLLRTGKAIEAERDYVVAGWASIEQATEGPPIWEVVAAHLRRKQVVEAAPVSRVNVRRGS